MLNIRHITVIFSLVVFMCGQVYGQQSPVDIYTQRADDFYLNGRLEQALTEYEKVLKLDPNNVYALHQSNVIREKLGLQTVSVEEQASGGGVPVENKYPVLPPRDYSKILPLLGTAHEDAKNRFSIQPPKGWWIDKYNPHFTVKFTDQGYEAFIFINILELEGPATLDENFKKFIETKNLQIEGSVPAYHALYNNDTLFQGKPAIEIRASFLAGINKVRITTYYVPHGNRVFMITTVCSEDLLNVWNPVFTACLKTFKTIGG